MRGTLVGILAGIILCYSVIKLAAFVETLKPRPVMCYAGTAV